MRTTTLALGAILLAVTSPALAEETASQMQSECLSDISSLRERHVSTRKHLSEADRRNLKSLGQAARIAVASDHEDACNEIHEVMVDLLQSRRNQLVEEGVVVEVEREMRLKTLRQAEDLQRSRAVLRASNLVGAELRNLQDEELGEIEDVLVDGTTGEVSHLLVATGGFLGIGEDLVGVPIEGLRATENLETVVLDMTPEQIGEAPKLQGDSLGQTADSGWKEQNALYFQSHLGESSQ